MNQKANEILKWIAIIFAGILFIYLIFFAISIIPTIILSPFIIYELVKEGGWAEIPLYYKLVIICGGLIFIGIILKVLGLSKWIEDKLK
ncbi:MAG: hypothetical protein WC349_03375 [Patescibacteria group bacterium]|jgi:hypothetical protein